MNKPVNRKQAPIVKENLPKVDKEEVVVEQEKRNTDAVSVEPSVVAKFYSTFDSKDLPDFSSFLSRDEQLLNKSYLNDKDFQQAEPEAYEKIKLATEETEKFYTVFSNYSKDSEFINRETNYINYKQEKNVLTQDDIIKYNELVENYKSNYSNLDINQIYKDKETKINLLMSEADQFLRTKYDETKKERVGKNLADINYMFDYKNYDLLAGSDYRSTVSLNQFDIIPGKSTSDINLNEATTEYSSFDFLERQVDFVEKKFVNNAIPAFKSILTKGLDRLKNSKNEELDLTNGSDIDLLVSSIFAVSDSEKAKKLRNEVISYDTLDGKKYNLYTNKDKFNALIEEMTPTQLQKLYELTSKNFYDKNFYFENDEQITYFQTNVSLDIEDINQTKLVQSKIKNQAYVQVLSDYNVKKESAKEAYLAASLDKEVVSEEYFLTGEKAVDITLKDFFAKNLYDENTSQQRTLNELMLMFKEEHKEEIDIAKEYFLNPDNSYAKGGMFGEGSIKLTPEEIINADFDNKIFNFEFAEIELSKTKQKELKRLQKKYKKNNTLLEDVEYISSIDADGKKYYETVIPIKDEEGNIIDSQLGIPITNPKDVKEINKALESEIEINQKIMIELHAILTRQGIRQKELDFDQIMLSNAINIFAASEIYGNIDFPEIIERTSKDISELEDAKELSWWDYTKSFVWTLLVSDNPMGFGFDKDAFNERLEYKKRQKKLNIDPVIEDKHRKAKTYLDIKAQSDNDIESIRPLVYKAYGDLLKDLDKALSITEIETVFPNTLSYSDKMVTNKYSKTAGMNFTESYIPNYTDIDLNKPQTEKTSMLQNLIKLTKESNVTVVKNKINYLGAETKNKKETQLTINNLNTALSKAKEDNQKISLEFYPMIVDDKTSAYQINIGKESYTIYANKEEMRAAGEQLQIRSVKNIDYNLLQKTGEWFYPTLNREGFNKNRIIINKDLDIFWNYEDVDGKTIKEKIPGKFDNSITIDQLQNYIQAEINDLINL